jgi:hypothetical protein
LWERVIVVLAEHFLPIRAERWAQEETPRGWRRGFVIRRLHPVWGAELAAQAGATPRTVALIRQHHSTAEMMHCWRRFRPRMTHNEIR